MFRLLLVPLAGAVALASCGGNDDPTISLVVLPVGTGAGSVTSAEAGIDCGADCTGDLKEGAQVTLTATANAGSTFVGWSGACTGTGTCSLTASSQAMAVVATFALNNSLSVSVNGSGTVTSSPGGIDCGGDCMEVYSAGTMVTLSASAAAGSSFTGWTGACAGTGSCVVTIDSAKTVEATFTTNRYELAVTKSGTGAGSVTSAPAGIACGDDCTEDYNHGTSVTLTATAATGSTFVGWSGGGCSGTDPCVVNLAAATTVTANFSLDSVGLTVMKAGNGSGTVSSGPVGIDCGADCGEDYPYNTTVFLAAAPAAGSTFTGWSGGGCSGTSTCATTVTEAVTVTASFTLDSHTLTVAKSGDGTGTVTSSPAGINCGADCTEVYDFGTVVTLTAAPSPGASFTGWSGGACSPMTNPCITTISGATAAIANFAVCTGSQTFAFTGALQTFTVPACATSITIDAFGAEGGTSTGQSGGLNFSGGLGARARGTFAVAGGQQISILVGGRGANSNCGSGGGGGSFAVRSGTLLLAAGGGGGGFHCNAIGGANGVGGNTTVTGGTGVCGTLLVRNPTAGGTNGNGANAFFGGGGGGFLTAGTSSQTTNAGGGAFPGVGGTTGGGFGGGGGYHGFCCGGSGGGGGFSGGGGSAVDGCAGGGGGSQNTGTNQTMTAATRAGNGVVTITW